MSVRIRLRANWPVFACLAVARAAAQSPVSMAPAGGARYVVPAAPPDSAPPAAAADSVQHSRTLTRFVTISRTPNGEWRELDLVMAPTLTYSPETGFGTGLGLVVSRLEGAPGSGQRPSTFQVSTQFTQEQQYTLTAQGDVWTRGNGYRFTYNATWARNPGKFYGIGDGNSARAEKYSPTVERLFAAAWKNVAPHFFVGTQALIEHVSLVVNDTGPLTSGSVPGQNGGNLVQLGLVASYDTRAPYYNPQHGLQANLTLARSARAIGSEYSYARATLDLRGYHEVFAGFVTAGQLWADAVRGAPPFDRVPKIGGSQLLRGVSYARYRDQGAMIAQGELRSPAWHRFGVVTFAGVGATGAGFDAVAADRFHFAGGFGLRYSLTEHDRLNIRIDRGWGRASSGTYFTINEAF